VAAVEAFNCAGAGNVPAAEAWFVRRHMKIHDLTDQTGRAFAFEVSNTFLTRRAVYRVIRTIPGARLLKEPRWFAWDSDDHFCEFELERVLFRIWEPWGDSDRYWIGPEPPTWVPQIERVRATFARARPFFGML